MAMIKMRIDDGDSDRDDGYPETPITILVTEAVARAARTDAMRSAADELRARALAAWECDEDRRNSGVLLARAYALELAADTIARPGKARA